MIGSRIGPAVGPRFGVASGVSIDQISDSGLQAGASEADIIQAHKHLMGRVHPDKGGSNYLAAQINLAKQTLLGR